MKLNGWTWLTAGLIITIMSGYIYFFVPRNGQPNNAMVLFFFIGIVFVVIGVTKIFFRRMDNKSVLDSIAKEPAEQKIVTMPTMESKPNKVDEAIIQLARQQAQQTQQIKTVIQPSMNASTPSHHIPTSSAHEKPHSNSFTNIYQYKGPVHTATTGVHAQHPVSQHTQQQSTLHHTAAVHNAQQHQTPATHDISHHTEQHHPVQNTTEHSIKCSKCSNVNPGHSNYCHKCGNRLK